MEEKSIIELYNDMSLSDKRRALSEDLMELTVIARKLLSDITEPLPEVSSSEFIDLFNRDLTEEEFLSTYYKHILDFKEVLAIYLDKVTSLYYENDEESN